MSSIVTQQKIREISEILRSNNSQVEKLERLCSKNPKLRRKVLFDTNPNMYFTRRRRRFYPKHISIRNCDYIDGENLVRIFLNLPIREYGDGETTWFKCLIKCIDDEILPIVDREGNTLSLNFYTDFTKSEFKSAINERFNLIESRKYMRERKLSKKAYIAYNNLVHPNNPWLRSKTASFDDIQQHFNHTPIVTGYDKDIVVLSRFLTNTYVRDRDKSILAYRALGAEILPPQTVLDLINMNSRNMVENYNHQQREFKNLLYQNPDSILLYSPIDDSPSTLDFYKKIQIIHHQRGTQKPTDLSNTSTFDELLAEYRNLGYE